MSSIKETLKKCVPLRKLASTLKQMPADIGAVRNFLAERKETPQDGPIRVGFLCQYLPSWAKIESIYQMMEKDDRFEPVLIALPDDILHGQRENPDDLRNPIHEYLLEKGYSKAINALIGKDSYLDLKKLKLSYIFYPRPYNGRLPASYSSQVVSRYCRILLIMYGILLSKDLTDVVLNRDFMRNVYCYFAEEAYICKTNIHRGWLAHKLGLQKSVCLGLPVLENLLACRDQHSPSWDFSQNQFRVIWTPRWTTDKTEGGSNFFTYYQHLLDYAQEHPDMDLLFRPHPLTFSNFISTGEMTQQQVDDYLARIAAIPNTSLDKQSQYEATLWESSVMISDFSSMMAEYLITGKPLIFCTSNMEMELTAFGNRLAEGCYCVDNRQELFETLQMLYSGNDPKRELRQQIVQEAFGDQIAGATGQILDFIAAGSQ